MSVENLLKRYQEEHEEDTVSRKVESHSRKEKKRQIVQQAREIISIRKDELDTSNSRELEKNIKAMARGVIQNICDKEYSMYMFGNEDVYDMVENLSRSLFGLGVIEPLLKDPSITEVMINGPSRIFIEKGGQIYQAKDDGGQYLEFANERELRFIIEKIVSPINRKVDESDPIVDARLPDGSRVNVALCPVALDGSSITIRKFPEKPYTMEQLVQHNSLSTDVAELLQDLVRARYNILVSGGTGSGKTTFLNALSMFIPSRERVITVEDAAELKFNQVPNLVRLETRPPNIESRGEITMRQLVKTALRMRPDRIVVGEVRSGEALDMLQAMNTGHDGSMSTGHANTAEDMLIRLETMVLMAGMELPVKAIRQQISSAVDIIVHLGKLRDGSRRVTEIIEIGSLDGDEIQTQHLFRFVEDESAATIQSLFGALQYTGLPLRRRGKFLSAGIIDYERHFK